MKEEAGPDYGPAAGPEDLAEIFGQTTGSHAMNGVFALTRGNMQKPFSVCRLTEPAAAVGVLGAGGGFPNL